MTGILLNPMEPLNLAIFNILLVRGQDFTVTDRESMLDFLRNHLRPLIGLVRRGLTVFIDYREIAVDLPDNDRTEFRQLLSTILRLMVGNLIIRG